MRYNGMSMSNNMDLLEMNIKGLMNRKETTGRQSIVYGSGVPCQCVVTRSKNDCDKPCDADLKQSILFAESRLSLDCIFLEPKDEEVLWANIYGKYLWNSRMNHSTV